MTPTCRRRRILRMLRWVAGLVILLAGIAGLLLPFLPGWVLIGAGIVILAPGGRLARWARRMRGRLSDRRHKDDSQDAP